MQGLNQVDSLSGPPAAAWGDGGGGSGAMPNLDDDYGSGGPDSRKLVASELGGWINRQEQVVRDLRKMQEHGQEQMRQSVEDALTCHQLTLERLLVWYLDPNQQKLKGQGSGNLAPSPSPSNQPSPQPSEHGERTPPFGRSDDQPAGGKRPSPPMLPQGAPPPSEPAPAFDSGLQEPPDIPAGEPSSPRTKAARSSARNFPAPPPDDSLDGTMELEGGDNSTEFGTKRNSVRQSISKHIAQPFSSFAQRWNPAGSPAGGQKSKAGKRNSEGWNTAQSLPVLPGRNRQDNEDLSGEYSENSGDKAQKPTMSTMTHDLLSMAKGSAESSSSRKNSICSNRSGRASHRNSHRNSASVAAQDDSPVGLHPALRAQDGAPKLAAAGSSEIGGVNQAGAQNTSRSSQSSVANVNSMQFGSMQIGITQHNSESNAEPSPGATPPRADKVCAFNVPPADETDDDAKSSSGFSSEVSGSEGSRPSQLTDDPANTSRKTRRFSDWEKELRSKNLTADIDKVVSELNSDPHKHWKSGTMHKLENFVKHKYFDAFTAAALISNAILIGVQVNWRASILEDKPIMAFFVIDLVYCCIFVCELLARLAADGFLKFFKEGQFEWNWFDTFVVMLQVIEVVIQSVTFDADDEGKTGSSGGFSNFLILGRLARVARIIRVVRVIRVMRFFRSFRLLVSMVLATLRSGVWAAMLLFMIMYICAIVFTQATTYHLIDTAHDVAESGVTMFRAPDSNAGLNQEDLGRELVKFYWGTVPRSIFTLLKSILGGVDWENVVLPLADVGWAYVGIFVGYTLFVQLAVMNVVTGLFLQSAIEQAQQDQEHVIQLRLSEKVKFVAKLHMLFEELDSSRDGTISLDEFETHLKNEHMQALIQTFEIDNADAWTLFKLLDSDGGGSVDIDEFVDGCIRLKGGAKSIQMAQVMYHHKWIMDKLVELSDQLRPISANQKYLIARMDKMDPDNSPDHQSGPSRRGSSVSLLPGTLKRNRTASMMSAASEGSPKNRQKPKNGSRRGSSEETVHEEVAENVPSPHPPPPFLKP